MSVWTVSASRPAKSVRKDFTTSEQVAIGKALESELEGRVGNPNLKGSIPENFPELPKGDTRDLAAKAI